MIGAFCLNSLMRVINPAPKRAIPNPQQHSSLGSILFRSNTRLHDLRFLDHMLERDYMQKSEFLKALSDMWKDFDSRVLRNLGIQAVILMVPTIAESQVSMELNSLKNTCASPDYTVSHCPAIECPTVCQIYDILLRIFSVPTTCPAVDIEWPPRQSSNVTTQPAKDLDTAKRSINCNSEIGWWTWSKWLVTAASLSHGASSEIGSQSDGESNNSIVFVGVMLLTKPSDNLFSQFGEVVPMKIPVGEGCGFVQFANRCVKAGNFKATFDRKGAEDAS
ncbi:unnamed protein product [Arabis nemorensis]|uniref:RRM domain-containing protein n=1 Tax=Arabis nemorensis TaxID=586526 RepID=A0A565B2C4_9BRAS|nr:unnamed protein product [Arabis nemorensis]